MRQLRTGWPGCSARSPPRLCASAWPACCKPGPLSRARARASSPRRRTLPILAGCGELAGTIRRGGDWSPGQDGLVLRAAAKAFGPVTVLKPGADGDQVQFGEDHDRGLARVYLIQVGEHFDAATPLQPGDPRPPPPSQAAVTGAQESALDDAVNRLRAAIEDAARPMRDDLEKADAVAARSFWIRLGSIDSVCQFVREWPASSLRNELLEELLSGLRRLREEFRQAAGLPPALPAPAEPARPWKLPRPRRPRHAPRDHRPGTGRGDRSLARGTSGRADAG